MVNSERIITEATTTPQESKNGAQQERRKAGLRLAALAGILLWLSHPPIGLWPLAWVAIAPLIASVTRARHIGQAALRGYLFGWAFLGPTWYWVGLTIIAWTHSYIGWVAWFGLTLILAGFYAAWGGVAWWVARRTVSSWRIVALAAGWVVMEWARTLGTLTMPWAQLSYSQFRVLPLLQIAEITGAYGVSFLILLVNAALWDLWTRRQNGQPGSGRSAIAAFALTALVFVYGLGRLNTPEKGAPIPVAAVQINLNPLSAASTEPNVVWPLFEQLTAQAVAATPKPALLVWAESDAPGDALYNGPTRARLTDLSQRYRIPMLVCTHTENKETGVKQNATVLFLPDGSPPQVYGKQQLVPFGEFIPFRALWPAFLSQAFGFFAEDVVPGSGATVLRMAPIPDPSPKNRGGETDPSSPLSPVLGGKGSGDRGLALGPFICYESMYPRYARDMARAGADLLVTQSNDAWFQSRAAQEQHLAAVVLRAIENRRDVVRSTTNGITGLLDSQGRLLQQAVPNTRAVVVGTVQRLQGKTPYTRFGDWFVVLCGGALLLAIGTKISPPHCKGSALNGSRLDLATLETQSAQRESREETL